MKPLIFSIVLGLIGLHSPGAASQSQPDFLKAIASGNVAAVRQMLNTDPNLANAHGPEGTSAILYAAYHRQPQIAAELLPYRKANLTVFESAAMGEIARLQTLLHQNPKLVRATSTDGFTPLHLASFFGQTASQQVLIRAGADLEVHSQNLLNATPLQSAVAARQPQSAAVLLAHHANPNCRGESGYTPLFEAAGSGQVEVVTLLLKYGADPWIKGTDGKTALDLAAEAHQARIKEILLKGDR